MKWSNTLTSQSWWSTKQYISLINSYDNIHFPLFSKGMKQKLYVPPPSPRNNELKLLKDRISFIQVIVNKLKLMGVSEKKTGVKRGWYNYMTKQNFCGHIKFYKPIAIHPFKDTFKIQNLHVLLGSILCRFDNSTLITVGLEQLTIPLGSTYRAFCSLRSLVQFVHSFSPLSVKSNYKSKSDKLSSRIHVFTNVH